MGGRGSLAARVLTIATGPAGNSRTHEDILLLAAITAEGDELTEQEIHLLLALSASQIPDSAPCESGLETILERASEQAVGGIETRNMELFQQETDKLDHWAEDQRRAQKGKLDEFDVQTKALRKQVREASSLPEKLKLQQQLRALERQRIDAWKVFDDKSRAIEEDRDRIEADAARLLAQSLSEEHLFSIHWSLQ